MRACRAASNAQVEGEKEKMSMIRGLKREALLRYKLRHSLRNTANRLQVYALITRVEHRPGCEVGESM